MERSVVRIHLFAINDFMLASLAGEQNNRLISNFHKQQMVKNKITKLRNKYVFHSLETKTNVMFT